MKMQKKRKKIHNKNCKPNERQTSFDPKGSQAAVAATVPKLHIGMRACFNTNTESQAWQLPKVQR